MRNILYGTHIPRYYIVTHTPHLQNLTTGGVAHHVLGIGKGPKSPVAR